MANDELVSDYMFGADASKYLLTTERKLALYRRYGLLKYSKLGKNFVYRRQWLDEFMENWKGYDLSNEGKVRLAINGKRWKEEHKL